MADTKGKQNIINHIALVMDMSGSMRGREGDLIEVVDAQIEHLALRSIELNQETRVTVYTFDYWNSIECVFYDKDVLRMPSLKGHYKPRGYTALLDATGKALDDLAKEAQLYGDHAFLTCVFTDGAENDSRKYSAFDMKSKINRLADNWTVAVLVPSEGYRASAERYGFPSENIAVWSAVGVKGGMTQVGDTIRQATDVFMTNRSLGIRGSKSLFSTGADKVNYQTVASLGLKPLDKDQFALIPVGPSSHDSEIRDFVQSVNNGQYKAGQAYYELTKPEKIQGQKYLAVVEKDAATGRLTSKVFIGDQIRKLISLPDYEVTVRPEQNKQYAIFVQSTSTNRKLKVGQKVLILKEV